MSNLVQFDIKSKGEEFRLRALLEDLILSHRELRGQYRPPYQLALAVWYQKSSTNPEQFLLELVTSDTPFEGITIPDRLSLHWKRGLDVPPYVSVRSASVEYFSKLLKGLPSETTAYRNNYEVLYFDKTILSQDILSFFNVITEPRGLAKGWYISESEYVRSKSIRELLSLHGHSRPMVGLVKVEESADFDNCRGILHVEVEQRWMPFTPEGIQAHTYYNDYQSGRAVYFIFEGGSLYEVLKFEVKTAPDYATKFGLLGPTPNDRYPEVYLRAVHPSAQPTA
jgi:hypothetical protein